MAACALAWATAFEPTCQSEAAAMQQWFQKKQSMKMTREGQEIQMIAAKLLTEHNEQRLPNAG
jgi:hypothetical protein